MGCGREEWDVGREREWGVRGEEGRELGVRWDGERFGCERGKEREWGVSGEGKSGVRGKRESRV